MENIKSVKKAVVNKGSRKRFIAVNVWQTEFGPVSERAIYDIYAQKFGVELHNMKKYSFTHCVTALRKLEEDLLDSQEEFTKNN